MGPSIQGQHPSDFEQRGSGLLDLLWLDKLSEPWPSRGLAVPDVVAEVLARVVRFGELPMLGVAVPREVARLRCAGRENGVVAGRTQPFAKEALLLADAVELLDPRTPGSVGDRIRLELPGSTLGDAKLGAG